MTDFGEIIKYIESEMGIDTDSIGIISVASAINKHVSQAELDNQKFAHLMSDSNRVQDLINDLTVAETWFFRDSECFKFLKQELSNQRFKYTSSNKLRILSAPSSTGEEPYSIAMLLIDLGFKTTEFDIVAVDINPVSLNKARNGIYGRTSFRSDFANFKQRYFEPTNDNNFTIDSRIKSIPDFRQANIVKSNFLANEAKFDYIFCKNLLIYLNVEARNAVLQNINRLLRSEGVLFAGLSETAYFTRNHFEHVQHDMAFACKQIVHSNTSEPTLFTKSNIKTTEKATPKTTKMIPKISEKQHHQSQGENKDELYEQLKILANQGSYIDAEQICNELLISDNGDYRALYVMGLISNASGKISEAKDYFHKVLYLHPDHYESLVHTSLIYESSGEHELANIYRERAERVFIKQSNS
ncbi:MAG: methyltransferase domain-containing protein [Candidatus Kapabacteria bacterium]|nr:methyltransferase domain-containing protein [Candidatus Kapabacteria bacterium]